MKTGQSAKDKTLRERCAHRLGLSEGMGLLLAAAFILVPLLPGEYPVFVATEVLILGLFAMSFNLIYGYMGQISFGHAAYFGLGAYATALFMQYLQQDTGAVGYAGFFASLLVAIPVSALGALIIGFFIVRLTGIYFAMLSLAFGELMFYVVFSWYSFTKGDDGIQGLLPPPLFRDAHNYYYFTLAVVACALIVMWRITRSPFGYMLRMVRENAQRTAFVGVNIRLCMLANFVLAGAFAGLAGALWGPFQRSVSPGLLGWHESGIAVFMSLIGGASYFIGPLVGSVVYTGLHAYVTRLTVYWPLTIGAIIMAVVLFAPGGLLSLADDTVKNFRHRNNRRSNREGPTP